MLKNKPKISKFFSINFLLIVLLSVLSFLLFPAEKVLAAGNTSGYAWSENIGWLSFNCDHTSLGLPLGGNTCAGASYGVLTTDDALYGYAWSENIGWISLNCNEEPIGGTNHCLTGGDGLVDYGVTNTNGVLGGYGWGENVGWVDFNPVGDEGVVIDVGTGVFSGYAWSENIGWISFGDGASYYAETLWRGTLGQLDSPSNLHHTNNPETPLEIWWEWDPVPNATGYEIYLWENPVYNPVGASNSTSFTLSTVSDLITPLSFNANYTIKVKAVDSTATYTDSELSSPASAYASAASPITLSGTVVSNSQINWSWQSGGGNSGFYASNTQGGSKGWTTDLFWDQAGLACGTAYTLQVKAKNAEFDSLAGPGDETEWKDSDSITIAALTAPSGAQLTDITDTSMKLTWTDTLNEEGYKIERAEGDDTPGIYSEIYDSAAPDIISYDDAGLTQNTHYWYRVKAYSSIACDSNYSNVADGWTVGPKIAINPITYPFGNIDYDYNFGVVEPGKTKSISMLICNLGDANLIVSSASINPIGDFTSTAPAGSFTLGVDSSYDNCDNNLAAQAKKEVVITFTSQCSPGPVTSQAGFILLNNDENKTVSLKGVCLESPVGEGQASENIIYDGRIMANPPPSFVEFLEKLQFSEKIKPR